MQKAIFVENGVYTSTLNHELNDGWKVLSVTPQHVSVTGEYYNSVKGGFLVILEKSNENH